MTYDEFLLKMKEAGYETRQGKYLAFRAPGAVNFINVKTLGTYYADDHLLVRLEKIVARLALLRKKITVSGFSLK